MLLKKAVAMKPPSHLKTAGKQLWNDVMGEYSFESSHQFKLLQLLCETLDRLEQCKKQLRADGLFVTDRFDQLKAHPALREEREHRVLFLRLCRELSLDIEPPAESRAPRRY